MSHTMVVISLEPLKLQSVAGLKSLKPLGLSLEIIMDMFEDGRFSASSMLAKLGKRAMWTGGSWWLTHLRTSRMVTDTFENKQNGDWHIWEVQCCLTCETWSRVVTGRLCKETEWWLTHPRKSRMVTDTFEKNQFDSVLPGYVLCVCVWYSSQVLLLPSSLTATLIVVKLHQQHILLAHSQSWICIHTWRESVSGIIRSGTDVRVTVWNGVIVVWLLAMCDTYVC